MINLQELIEKIDYLPPFNKTALKALSILKDEDYSTRALSDVIKFDPSLTANVLKIVNSAQYAKAKSIDNILTAVNFLGKKELHSIILVSASHDYFKSQMDGYETSQGEIWEHSISVCIISNELSYLEPEIDPDTLFTAALLHDIGKIIMSQYISKEFNEINKLVQDKGLDFITAEKQIVGYTHAWIGAAILKKWNFPKKIVDSVRNHHSPDKVTEPLVRILLLSDYISFVLGKLSQIDGLSYKGYNKVLEYYELDQVQLDRIVSHSVDKLNSLLGKFLL